MHQKFKAYIKNSCSEQEYEEVKQFVADKKNDLFIDGLLRETWKENLKETQDVEPDNHLLNRIHHEIALAEKSPKQAIRMYQLISGVAMVLVVGLLFGILLVKPSSNEILTQTITTPYGGRTNFTLSDGTEVWLNAGSAITYPTQFADTRKVAIKGEAYFKVVHNSQPFIVESKYGYVEVMGTEFDVKAYDDEAFVTTLVNGSVVYRSNNDKEVLLAPGYQVTNSSEKLVTRKVETEIFTSWKDGKLIFREEPLENIVSRLERWYNVDIRLEGDNIRNLKYNGTIELESFSEVLELIKVTTPIEYSFDRKTRILTITSVR